MTKLAFAERVLPRAADLWVQASSDQRQRFQQLFFPDGIAFDGNRFAFGCVLYEMLTDARVALQRRRISSRKLKQIVSRCLEEDPGRRCQSAAELQQQLASITPGTRGTGVAVAAAALLALSAAAAYFYLHRAPTLTDRDTIVLADFTNTTGDPVFDDTLRQGLAVQLQQSPFLSLVSDARIRKTMALMDQPPDARLTSDIAQSVCVRTASAAVLEGSIASLGSQYVVGLRARNCTTGDILADDQAQAARKEDVLGALSQMASGFRARVGESPASIEKHSMPLEEATTSSLEALKAYSAAWKAIMSAGWVRGHPLFQRAVAIDPDFALAHAQVGFGYSVMGESALARPSTLKAYQLRDRASDVERFFIERCTTATSPMDAMARLQLARALVLSGDTAKAKNAYNDLFALWKDADPTIPVVNESRAEYAALQ
jgi:hypothetical protein